MHAKLIVKLTRRDLANELLSVLKEYKELGIAKQIDYQKFYLYSIISNSAALSDLYPDPIAPEMVDNCTKEPSEAERMADILDFVADKDAITTEMIVKRFDFTATTAKRYLRRLTEFGYLKAHGGNKNRTYQVLF